MRLAGEWREKWYFDTMSFTRQVFYFTFFRRDSNCAQSCQDTLCYTFMKKRVNTINTQKLLINSTNIYKETLCFFFLFFFCFYVQLMCNNFYIYSIYKKYSIYYSLISGRNGQTFKSSNMMISLREPHPIIYIYICSYIYT